MLKQNRLYYLVALFCLILAAPSIHAQTLRERHDRIRSAMEGADYKTALTEFQSLSTTDPTAFTLNNYDYLLGRLSEHVGNSATATASYQKAVARNSILSQYALWHLAELARAMGDLTLEREKLRQLLATAPASLLRDAATARLAESFFESKDYASAIKIFRPRADAKGNSSAREALALIGQAYLQSGQKDAAREAINYFQKVTTQFPDSSTARDALNFTGGAYSRLKRFDDAINAYKSYIERYGGGTNAERPYLNIIDTFRDAGRDAEALSWAEAARARFK